MIWCLKFVLSSHRECACDSMTIQDIVYFIQNICLHFLHLLSYILFTLFTLFSNRSSFIVHFIFSTIFYFKYKITVSVILCCYCIKYFGLCIHYILAIGSWIHLWSFLYSTLKMLGTNANEWWSFGHSFAGRHLCNYSHDFFLLRILHRSTILTFIQEALCHLYCCTFYPSYASNVESTSI